MDRQKELRKIYRLRSEKRKELRSAGVTAKYKTILHDLCVAEINLETI